MGPVHLEGMSRWFVVPAAWAWWVTLAYCSLPPIVVVYIPGPDHPGGDQR